MRPVSFPFLVYSRSTHPLPLLPPRRSLSTRQFAGVALKSSWTSLSVLFLSNSGSVRRSSNESISRSDTPPSTLDLALANFVAPLGFYRATTVPGCWIYSLRQWFVHGIVSETRDLLLQTNGTGDDVTVAPAATLVGRPCA